MIAVDIAKLFNKSVLIVAKCIVNNIIFVLPLFILKVLIVAKCIVNFVARTTEILDKSINSSKVYCKYIFQFNNIPAEECINSSKVYCKFFRSFFRRRKTFCINSSKVYCK